MKQFLIQTTQYTLITLLVISFVLYFILGNIQDLILMIFAVLLIINSSIFRISYKKFLIASATVMAIATFFNEFSFPVLASEFISLSFVLFAISVLKITARSIFSAYGKPFSNIYL